MGIDLDKIIAQYEKDGDDFGFTEVSEEEFENEVKTAVDEAVTEAVEKTEDATETYYKEQLLEVEKLILPFLIRLKNAKEVYIKWPHEVREPVIEGQIAKILSVTRQINEDNE